MFYRLIKQGIQISPLRINSFRINPRYFCQISTGEQQKTKENSIEKDKPDKSTRYPDYDVIYKHPNIKYAWLLNSFKYKMTVLTGVAIPILSITYLLNMLSLEMATVLGWPFITSTFWLYVIGRHFNYTIGFIYYKDMQSIKFAYVDKWGRRAEVETSAEEIAPLNDLPRRITDRFYRRIYIASLKYPLKLVVKGSGVRNEELLVNIVGDYE